MATLHYASGGSAAEVANAGFNLVDVQSVEQLNALPDGMKGLVWLNEADGVTSSFIDKVTPFIGNPKLYGFFLVDEPDPTGQWGTYATAADLKAESDYIHSNVPGAKTFITMMNMGSSADPDYSNTFNPANTGIDLYGVTSYPVRTGTDTVDYSQIDKAVAAAEAAGIPASKMVPTYQTFGGGAWMTDTDGKYVMPTAAQLETMLDHWDAAVPSPAFDYAYAWGSQQGDVALESSSELQAVSREHNLSTAAASDATISDDSSTATVASDATASDDSSTAAAASDATISDDSSTAAAASDTTASDDSSTVTVASDATASDDSSTAVVASDATISDDSSTATVASDTTISDDGSIAAAASDATTSDDGSTATAASDTTASDDGSTVTVASDATTSDGSSTATAASDTTTCDDSSVDRVLASMSNALSGGSESEPVVNSLDKTAGNGFAHTSQGNENVGANASKGGTAEIMSGRGGHDAFDFSWLQDKFQDKAQDKPNFDHDFFAGLRSGGVSSDALSAGTAAHDRSDHVSYDSSTGSLSFDSDGAEGATQTQLASHFPWQHHSL